MIAKGLNPLNPPIDSCEWIWKISTRPRIMFFIWLCWHNSVLTYQGIESLIHILRECSYAKSFWSKQGIPTKCKGSFDETTMIWIKLNSTSKAFIDRYGLPWKVICPMSIWHLWLIRNAFSFRTRKIDENFHIQCLKKKVAKFFATAMEGKVRPKEQLKEVSWQKPPMGWAKLNKDGSSLHTHTHTRLIVCTLLTQ